MKKSLLIALAFFGLALGTTNAQSCCTITKDNCEPKVCCPTTPDCCTDDAVGAKAVKPKKKADKVAATKKQQIKNAAINKEVAIIENKKVKL